MTRTALNLALCYYSIGDRDKLKKCFQRLLQISSGPEDDDRYFPTVVSQWRAGVTLTGLYIPIAKHGKGLLHV